MVTTISKLRVAEVQHKLETIEFCGELLKTYKRADFDAKGIYKGAGKHVRNSFATIYFDARAEDGDGETIVLDKDEGHTLFEPTSWEMIMFDLKATHYHIRVNAEGYVFGRELTSEQADVLRLHQDDNKPGDGPP